MDDFFFDWPKFFKNFLIGGHDENFRKFWPMKKISWLGSWTIGTKNFKFAPIRKRFRDSNEQLSPPHVLKSSGLIDNFKQGQKKLLAFR